MSCGLTGATVKDERAFESFRSNHERKSASHFEERFAALRVVGYFAVYRSLMDRGHIASNRWWPAYRRCAQLLQHLRPDGIASRTRSA